MLFAVPEGEAVRVKAAEPGSGMILISEAHAGVEGSTATTHANLVLTFDAV